MGFECRWKQHAINMREVARNVIVGYLTEVDHSVLKTKLVDATEKLCRRGVVVGRDREEHGYVQQFAAVPVKRVHDRLEVLVWCITGQADEPEFSFRWNEGLWNRAAGGYDNSSNDFFQVSADGRILYLGTAGSGVWRRPAAGWP